ncbi:carbon storage regulator CsrA [Tuberibacillus sp. Marseille-P3662]|uniref:carbon storage regulator CsrA n=1 Tax=Tuberibacillus sp. Marseille-P3662 TaxID=1965358 RepID=UPI000A1CCCBF|nr:carbon storage regulator CsrA [Tuberibacillus sp. Marseille-P3662]
MLVLNRKKNESIMIGDDIEIKIVDIDGEQIKLGIDAPNHVDIHRKEVYMSIQEANNEATQQQLSLDVLDQLKQLGK